MSRAEHRPIVFDIQRFCLHDGPGIRTVLFLKGCPLNCRWCQNPESIRSQPELALYPERCTGCGSCAEACPHDAIARPGPLVDRRRCQGCGACAIACAFEARRLVGRRPEIATLLRQIEADQSYFRETGGGLTLSGGEPLLQARRLKPLLERCRERGIDVTVETCGAVPWSAFQRILPLVDRFLFDLKAGDDALHARLTGLPMGRIVDNARRLLNADADVTFRMPVVPGENDGGESLAGVAELLIDLGRPKLTLLAYHRAGEDKIARIGSKQPKLGLTAKMGVEALAQAAETLSELGIEVTVESLEQRFEDRSRPSAFSERVRRLRQAVQSARPAVCSERALLWTEYFRAPSSRGKPRALQQGEALRHVLRQKRAAIYQDELLVGCFTAGRVGGSVFPELHGVAMMEDLLRFDDRPVNPLEVSEEVRRDLVTKVIPYWASRFLVFKAFPPLKGLSFIADQLSFERYVLNETGGISHFVPDLERLLRLGTSGIGAEAAERRETADRPEARAFYDGVIQVCAGLEEMAAQYVGVAAVQARRTTDPDRRAELEAIAQVCARVPREPAQSLHQALQAVLFVQIALNLESLDNSVCPGRLDLLLAPFYERDLAASRCDPARARELIGCFTVKMSEIVPVFSQRLTQVHGGLFNGQTVVVGGVDREGRDATNELTWAFLDAVDELRMRQPNYHARLHGDSPPEYVERISSMIRDGSGAPSLMNDDVVIPMLQRRGMSLADARDYSPVGCIEPVSCGATFGSTDAALVNVPICLERALGVKQGGAGTPPPFGCSTIDGIVRLFQLELDALVDELIDDLEAIELANARFHPTPLTSALLAGCLESGVDSTEGGARYNASGVQGVGIVDVADSLAALDEVVFRRRAFTLRELIAALKVDFDGHERLQAELLRAPKYGNDRAGADRWVEVVARLWSDSLERHRNTRGGPYLAGFYSVTSHQPFGEKTGALPSGRRAGRPLTNGISPADGLDRLGPTATLSSAASIDQGRWGRNGVNLNLKLDRSSLEGRRGLSALSGLIRGYFDQGGMQVQMNVMDHRVLLEAAADPSTHPWLLVRVSGYSAYFNDLSPSVQQEIIERSLHRG